MNPRKDCFVMNDNQPKHRCMQQAAPARHGAFGKHFIQSIHRISKLKLISQKSGSCCHETLILS